MKDIRILRFDGNKFRNYFSGYTFIQSTIILVEIFRGALIILIKIRQLSLLLLVMARESLSTIIIIALLSTLLVLSTRSATIQSVFGKNNMGQMLGEGDPCSNQALQIDSLCQPEKSNIQSYDTTTRERYSNFGDTDARMDTFMNQYNKFQAEELGTSGSHQNDSVSNKGNTNSNESVTPSVVGHNGRQSRRRRQS